MRGSEEVYVQICMCVCVCACVWMCLHLIVCVLLLEARCMLPFVGWVYLFVLCLLMNIIASTVPRKTLSKREQNNKIDDMKSRRQF